MDWVSLIGILIVILGVIAWRWYHRRPVQFFYMVSDTLEILGIDRYFRAELEPTQLRECVYGTHHLAAITGVSLPLTPTAFTFEEIEGTIQLIYVEIETPKTKMMYAGRINIPVRKRIFPRIIFKFNSLQIDGPDLVRRIREKVRMMEQFNILYYYTWTMPGSYWTSQIYYEFDRGGLDRIGKRAGERAVLRAQIFYSEFDTLVSYLEACLAEQRPPKILLYGPSGCGKSWLILTLAKLLRMNIYGIKINSGGFLTRSLFQSIWNGASYMCVYDNLDLELAEDVDTDRTVDFLKQSCVVDNRITVITATDLTRIPPALIEPDRFKVYYIGYVDANVYAQIIETYFPGVSPAPLPPDHTIPTVQIVRWAQEAAGSAGTPAGDYELFQTWLAEL